MHMPGGSESLQSPVPSHQQQPPGRCLKSPVPSRQSTGWMVEFATTNRLRELTAVVQSSHARWQSRSRLGTRWTDDLGPETRDTDRARCCW